MSKMIELVILNDENGNIIAKAPFATVKSGDIVEIDNHRGWFKVVTKILNFDSQMKDFMLQFYGVGCVEELSSVTAKWNPIEWGEDYEF